MGVGVDVHFAWYKCASSLVDLIPYPTNEKTGFKTLADGEEVPFEKERTAAAHRAHFIGLKKLQRNRVRKKVHKQQDLIRSRRVATQTL